MHSETETPAGMAAANETVPPCWDSALKCSCGDCPEGPQCTPVRLQRPVQRNTPSDVLASFGRAQHSQNQMTPLDDALPQRASSAIHLN